MDCGTTSNNVSKDLNNGSRYNNMNSYDNDDNNNNDKSNSNNNNDDNNSTPAGLGVYACYLYYVDMFIPVLLV